MNMKGRRRAVNPSKEVRQTVFGSDERRDDSAGRNVGVEAEGASTQTAPLFVPINHRIGVRCVATAVPSKVNQVVKVGQWLSQGNAAPSSHGNRTVAVHDGVNLSTRSIKKLERCSGVLEVEIPVQHAVNFHHIPIFVNTHCVSVVGQDNGGSRLYHEVGDGGVVHVLCTGGGSQGPSVQHGQVIALIGDFNKLHVVGNGS